MRLLSNFYALKLALPVAAAMTMLAVTLLALPVRAADPDDHDLYLKAPTAGSPDIEVGSDGTFVALVYFKYTGNGAVYLKSGEEINGWRTRANPLGFTSTPPKLVFSPTSTNTVYAVWQNRLTDKSIRYAVCNLARGVEPDCPTIGTVYSSTNDLRFPDLAVDANGLHLAWENVDTGGIETLYLSFPLSGLPAVNPTAVLTPAAGEEYDKPALAAANGVYLAFLNDDDGDEDAEKVQIYRSSSGGHTWNSSKTYDSNIWIGFSKWDNPTMAANGANASVVWDGYYNSGNLFALVGGSTSNDGLNWSDATYITSAQTADTGPSDTAGDQRPSRIDAAQGSPFQEEGLRPSLAISGTTGFAVAWQQRPDNQNLCQAGGGGEGQENEVNGSAEIYLYENNSVITGWNQVKHATPGDYSTYSIAPDIAIGPTGETHLAYMKAISLNSNCTLTVDYGIYYQGPPGFMQIATDSQGEGGGPFLPIIFRN